MEKVIYLLWPDANATAEHFGGELRTGLAERLLGIGAHGLQVNVMDDAVAAATGLRMINTRPQPEAVVSVWVDSAVDAFRRPFDEAIAAFAPRIAAYLVSESLPIRNTLHPPRLGQRTYGFAQVALLARPQRLSAEAWRDTWQNSHTQVAIDTQSTFHYAQNLVLRALTYAAPCYDAIIEEGFPTEAMSDTYAFFDAVGDDKKYQRNYGAMMDSCRRFIDMDRIDVLPTSQYLITPVGGQAYCVEETL